MTELLCCLVVVTFLPLGWAIFGEILRLRLDTGFDHRHPRIQIQSLEGLGARVYGAESNAVWIVGVACTVGLIVAASQSSFG